MLWMGLFGLFLSFAAYSSDNSRPDILLASLILLFLAWRVLRRPAKHFEPSKRFRTLRRLGLVGNEAQPGEED